VRPAWLTCGARRVNGHADSPALQPRREPRWEPPEPYNYPAALDSMGTIAAPLLASVSIALIAIILTSASAFRLVSAALLLLMLAAGAFVATVECSFMARQYVVTPSELEDWWTDSDAPGRRETLRREQRYYLSRFRFWAKRARFAYNVGILALSLGVVALLVPHGHADFGRLVVIALAALAFLAESVWLVTTLVCHQAPKLPKVAPEPPQSSSSGAGSGSL
jgi:hypothetical protein